LSPTSAVEPSKVDAMKVRALDARDAGAYQRLRLQALQESPAAFSASHADEAGRSMDEVIARIFRPPMDRSARWASSSAMSWPASWP